MIIGKSESGKVYHVLNKMDGSDRFSLCGCYLPENLQEDCTNPSDLDEKYTMCEKCMYNLRFKNIGD